MGLWKLQHIHQDCKQLFHALHPCGLCCHGAVHDLLGAMPVIVCRAFKSAHAFPEQSRDGADTVLVLG